MNFKYEVVPMFYFICGMMEHNEKFCHIVFDTSLENIEKPYKIWMKAERQRRTHAMGSKWLRQGNQVSRTNTVVEMKDGVANRGGQIGACDKSNPLISGRVVIVENNSLKGGG